MHLVLTALVLLLDGQVTIAFQPQPTIGAPSITSTDSICCLNGWVGDLWAEMIEVATYGPAERRILAERRKKAAAAEQQETRSSQSADDTREKEEMTFAEAKKRLQTESRDVDDIIDDDLSPAAFRRAAAAALANDGGDAEQSSPLDDFDGYALRDLLMAKWGAPLDVDFQRDASLNQVYCTVLPIAFGQKLKCRHETELDYLMHLQGVVEVLRKYDQLQDFVAFVDETNKAPKAGTDSVPFRLNLDEEQTRQIL